jgi:LysM repeat protein
MIHSNIRYLLPALLLVWCNGLLAQKNTPEDYIGQWKDVAVKKMQEHRIPASITLAQGILESGNGNSELARKGNNHFGIKCTPDWTGGKTYHDDDRRNECFRKYTNAAQSYEDHARFLQRPRYAALFELKPTDYKGWAHGLKKAGYATDPNYPQKLINLIERYELHDLDRGVDLAVRKPERQVTDKPVKRTPPSTDVITIGGSRQVEQFEGRIKYVRAREGDDFRKLARDLEMTHGMIARWNDMDKNASLQEGQMIFIQPKRKAARSALVHVVHTGEDLWSISQTHGVKLASLEKYNGISSGTPLQEGRTIHLRKPRR